MLYLSQMLGKPVVDAAGENIGTINDIAIATGEVFPRVTSLAFKGPDKIPFMLSWRKFVDNFDGERITLNVAASDIRFSYLQPDEVLLSRDLMSKQIVDTQGMKVVRVNDLKLSESRNQLRLLGAEVGARGILRGISPGFERFVAGIAHLFGGELDENLIAWNYMDLLDRDLSQVKLSVTHKRLHELHPADVADILEKLAPAQRARVFEHLDNEQAADTISELEDELQADVIDDLSERRASRPPRRDGSRRRGRHHRRPPLRQGRDTAAVDGRQGVERHPLPARLQGQDRGRHHDAGGHHRRRGHDGAAGHRPHAGGVGGARERLLHLRRRG